MAGNNGELSAGYKGFSLRIQSQQLIWLVIIIGFFVLFYFGGKMVANELSTVRDDHKIIIAEQATMRQSLGEQFDAMLFLLSLPEAERPRLVMPKELAKRLEQN